MVVLHRPYQTAPLQHLPSSACKLSLSENGREISNAAENSKVLASVRSFLTKVRKQKNSFSQQNEQASLEEQEEGQEGLKSSVSDVGCFGH